MGWGQGGSRRGSGRIERSRSGLRVEEGIKGSKGSEGWGTRRGGVQKGLEGLGGDFGGLGGAGGSEI